MSGQSFVDDGHAPLQSLETKPCLHCAGTQATVRQDRQIADALLGDATYCVCCDPETGNACPQCGSQNLEYGAYDYGCDSETGYADVGEGYRCLDCGSTGDVDDTAPALVMLAQEPRKPMTPADSAALSAGTSGPNRSQPPKRQFETAQGKNHYAHSDRIICRENGSCDGTPIALWCAPLDFRGDRMSDMNDLQNTFPIIPHESAGVDCCGCIVVTGYR
jgi:hypothetical protein